MLTQGIHRQIKSQKCYPPPARKNCLHSDNTRQSEMVVTDRRTEAACVQFIVRSHVMPEIVPPNTAALSPTKERFPTDRQCIQFCLQNFLALMPPTPPQPPPFICNALHLTTEKKFLIYNMQCLHRLCLQNTDRRPHVHAVTPICEKGQFLS